MPEQINSGMDTAFYIRSVIFFLPVLIGQHMIHFPYGSPLTDIELCQLAFLYIKIFGHFFKVVGNLVVYIILSKRIEISIAVCFYIGFFYKLVSHLVVVMAVLAVCVVSGNLFPVFVVQDCGNICFMPA